MRTANAWRPASVVAAVALAAASVVGVGAQKTAPQGKPAPPATPTPEKIAFIRSVKASGQTTSQVFTMNTDGKSQTQITSGGLGKNMPRWSPDLDPGTTGYQGKIAYIGNNRDLWLMNINGTGQTQVTFLNTLTGSTPAWSPVGGYVAFRIFSTGGVWVWGPFGSGSPATTQVVSGASGLGTFYSVCWTPDLKDAPGYQGKLLVSCGAGPNGYGTYAFDAAISETGELTVGAAPVFLIYGYYTNMAARPNGGYRVTYTRGYQGSANHVWVADIAYDEVNDVFAVTAEQDLTPTSQLLNEVPTWSTDGTRIAYRVAKDGVETTSEVYTGTVPEVLGGTFIPVRLTSNSVQDTQPGWSPPVF